MYFHALEKSNNYTIMFNIQTGCKREKLSHADYNLIFDNRVVEETPIELLEIGDLNVPGGQIVVCDPLVYSNTPPLNIRVNPGKYPVKIYIAKTKA